MTGLTLDELFALRSETPKPDDFDAYWDRALTELDEIPPCAQLVPAGPDVPGFRCADLWFTGIGGARIHARCVLPCDGRRHPAVLHFHGYRWHCADFSQILPFAAAGCAVFAMSCRGQGGPSQDNTAVDGPTYNGHIFRGILDAPDKLLYRQIFLDTVQLARAAASLPEVDAERMGVAGGSQGGGLALACAALEPRIRRAAVWFPFLCDYRRGWQLFTPESAYFELRGLFRNIDPTTSVRRSCSRGWAMWRWSISRRASGRTCAWRRHYAMPPCRWKLRCVPTTPSRRRNIWTCIRTSAMRNCRGFRTSFLRK